MKINYAEVEYELKFTFNSFKYMKDFNVKDLGAVEETPFAIIGVIGELLYGAFNHDKKVTYTREFVDEFLEGYIDNGGDIIDLFTEVSKELEESNFFKSLQAKDKSKKSKK